MIKRQVVKKNKTVKVTFVLDADDSRLPASVVGDFNEWDPKADPFRKRNNGTWSAAVTLKPGKKYQFRYRSDDGTWFDDDQAESYTASEVGTRNCVIST